MRNYKKEFFIGQKVFSSARIKGEIDWVSEDSCVVKTDKGYVNLPKSLLKPVKTRKVRQHPKVDECSLPGALVLIILALSFVLAITTLFPVNR